MKEFTFYATCLTWDEQIKKVKVLQEGETRKKALIAAMIKVSNDKEFEKYAQVEMYNVNLIDNI